MIVRSFIFILIIHPVTLFSQNWTPLGSGMNGQVLALCVYNNELIAGGSFTTAGGISANYIAKWNGSSWSPLGSMTPHVEAWSELVCMLAGPPPGSEDIAVLGSRRVARD